LFSSRRWAGLALLAFGATSGLAADAPRGGPAAASQSYVIGLLEADPARGDALAQGVVEALAGLNAAGGIGGHPIRLLRLGRGETWRMGAPLMARLLSEPGLLAVLGPTDGAGAHLAAQVATKRGVPVITLSAEASLTQAFDPWVFRGVPDDREQAQAVLDELLRAGPTDSATLVVPSGREGRERRLALVAACGAAQVTVAATLEVGEEPVALAAESAGIVLLWLDAVPARAFLEHLGPRRELRIAGSQRLETPVFLDRAPAAAEGMLLPAVGGDLALGYDLAGAIVAAARRSGAEPERVRAGLASGPPWRGRTGTIRFDGKGNRQGPIALGVVRQGALQAAAARP